MLHNLHNSDGVDPTSVQGNLPGAVFTLYPNFLSRELSDFFYETLLNAPVKQGRVHSGLEHRKSCVYSQLRNPDGTLKPYYYAGKKNTPFEYPDELVFLQDLVQKYTNCEYNSAIVNLYENGYDDIGWHSDDMRSLEPTSTIASISFGAPRWFDVRALDRAPDPEKELSIRTTHGNMMIMGPGMQTYYQHRIRREPTCAEPRINITFRLSKK